MTNEEKAREIAKRIVPDFLIEKDGLGEEQLGRNSCMEAAIKMAEWKDEQLEEELNLISDWFKHIAQMADDKKTLNGAVMKDSDAFDEIKCLAKRCAEYIDMKLYNK